MKPALARWALLAMAGLPSLHAAAQLPLASKPEWRRMPSPDTVTIEFDAAGPYSKPPWTYAAFRQFESVKPDAYVLIVHAFDCAKRRVATALLGRMSLDGERIEHGAMNSERILSKYNDPIPDPQQTYLQAAFDAVCR